MPPATGYLALPITVPVATLPAWIAPGADRITLQPNTTAQRAAAGEPGLQYALGIQYLHGDGVAKDDMQAYDWFNRAAEHGHARAQMELGVAYMTGKGVGLDYGKAFDWFGRSAAQKCPDAAFYLGKMLHEGLGMKKDEIRAFAWFMIAAQQGMSRAQAACGFMYMKGAGVRQDDAQAFAWFSKAAAQGHFDGCRSMGAMYYRGRGVEPDLAKAAHFFCQAGDAICPPAERGKTLLYPEGAFSNELLPYISLELDQRPAVTKLVLANQGIDDQGAKTIAAIIEKNRTLVSLDISGNRIGPIGAGAILAALQNNTTLMHCNVDKNPELKAEMHIAIQLNIQRTLRIAVLKARHVHLPKDLTSTLGIPPEVGQLILHALILRHQTLRDPQTGKPLFSTLEASERLLLELACVITHADAARSRPMDMLQ